MFGNFEIVPDNWEDLQMKLCWNFSFKIPLNTLTGGYNWNKLNFIIQYFSLTLESKL